MLVLGAEKIYGIYKGFDTLVDYWYEVCILQCLYVQSMLLHAEMDCDLPIFLVWKTTDDAHTILLGSAIL